MNPTLQQTVQHDQAKLDQEWAEAREWVWSLGAEQAQALDDLINNPERHKVLKAISASRPTFDALLYLAKLGYDQLINNCLDEQIAMELDPQAPEAEAHDG